MIAGGIVLAFSYSISGIWLALIGWFLLIAASAETNIARTQERFSGMRVRDIMVNNPVTVPKSLSVSQFIEEIFPSSRFATYPVTDNGEPVGLLSLNHLKRIPKERWGEAISDHMIGLDEAVVISPDDELDKVAIELAQTRVGRALVVEHGELVGLVSMTDLSRWLR
jgi:CBS domain-containing protein